MGVKPCLQLLRPYAFQPLLVSSAVYSRFYAAAHQSYTARGKRCYSSSPDSVPHGSPRSANGQLSADDPLSAAEQLLKRKERIEKLKASDALVYPRLGQTLKDDGVTHTDVASFKKKHMDLTKESPPENDLFTLSGRIMSIRRSSNKLMFLDLQGSFTRQQIIISFAAVAAESQVTLADFNKALKPLLRGDFISICGKAQCTDAGDLRLKATSLPQLLAPALVPIPATVTNEKTKIQNKSLDILVSQATSDVLRFRFHMVSWLRQFFNAKNFLEVQTPILAEYAGGAAARPFLTSATEFPSKELALRIAPELWLKRLVIGGFDNIYEIGPAFRNEGLDGTHNAEFTMCEFYSAYASLPSLIETTKDLVWNLAKLSRSMIDSTFVTLEMPSLDYFEMDNYKQVEFLPALEEALGIQFPDLSRPDALDRLKDCLTSQTSYVFPPDTSLNKLLDNLAGTYLEPESMDRPIFIMHHPACMSPLAKSFTCHRTGQLVSARAELFVHGREISNMYEEENDPFEQRRKFESQVVARQSGNADADEGQARIDESYIQALELGLPPTGGWGCGVDRLVMLFSGAKRISDTLSFGNLRNVVSTSQAGKP